MIGGNCFAQRELREGAVAENFGIVGIAAGGLSVSALRDRIAVNG
jgi:hypothetical protein